MRCAGRLEYRRGHQVRLEHRVVRDAGDKRHRDHVGLDLRFRRARGPSDTSTVVIKEASGGPGWASGFCPLRHKAGHERRSGLELDISEELSPEGPEPVGMPALGFLAGFAAQLVIPGLVVPEADDRLDPGFHFLGRGQDPGGRREPIGQGEHDAGVAHGLRDSAAVGADDRDAVDHGFDGRERLVLEPERGQQSDPRPAPEPPGIGGVAHDVEVDAGDGSRPQAASVLRLARLSTTRSGISGRRRPSSAAMRAKG